MPSTWKNIKVKLSTVALLDRFIRDLEAEAENGNFTMPGELRNDDGHLICRDGITRDDAIRELLRRVREHRGRAKRQRRKPDNGAQTNPRNPIASANGTSHPPTVDGPLG